MASPPNTEQLTPLDLMMPRVYVSALLTFQTVESTSAISKRLQAGLDDLTRKLPWLTGRVISIPDTSGKVEIQWDGRQAAKTPTLINKGTIKDAYDDLTAQGMPPAAIPAEVWPAPVMIDDALSAAGAPVFAASIFGFAGGKGVGLCVSMHHAVCDATGFAQVVGWWAQSAAAPGSVAPGPTAWAGGRAARLAEALSAHAPAVAALPADELYAAHPEHSKLPPALPAELARSTAKVYAVPMARLDALKADLAGCMPAPPTTNALTCALGWSAITRARARRNPGLAAESSRLVTAVSGRRRLGGGKFATAEAPYIGNLVLYALASAGATDLSAAAAGTDDARQTLAGVCQAIAQSQAPSKVGARHIAEVCRLVDLAGDPRALFPGWDLFGSRDLTITSWANFDFYGMEFGAGLGRPDFMRIPYTEADGVVLVLPRKRKLAGEGNSGEKLEIMVMLRRDDLGELECDAVWKSLVE